MRDKVKRFISILMTALMLVNLLPVGALADGITSIGYKPETVANYNRIVYVYVKVTGNTDGLVLNKDGWYTIGTVSIANMPNPSNYRYSSYGEHVDYVWSTEWFSKKIYASSVSGINHERNKTIPLEKVKWTGTVGDQSFGFIRVDSGATDYPNASKYTWHLDGYVNVEDVQAEYTVRYVDQDTGIVLQTAAIGKGKLGSTISHKAPKTVAYNGKDYTRQGEPNQTFTLVSPENTFNIYYRRPYGYTVEYYYDDVKDKDATVIGESQLCGTKINTYTPKPKVGYELDETKTTKLPLTIQADESKNVIRVYYKKIGYTVTYEPDEHGDFKARAYNAKHGDATPAFDGETTGKPGWTFDGWEPEVADTVTGNATYTAVFVPDENQTATVLCTIDEKQIGYGTVYPSIYQTILQATGKLKGGKPISGSMATANAGYKFVGWYKVTGEETYEWVTGDPELTSELAESKLNRDEKTDLYQNTVFVARFEPDAGAKVPVTYEAENGTLEGITSQEAQVVTGEGLTDVKAATPNKGYKFDGWYAVDKNGDKHLISGLDPAEKLDAKTAKENLNKDGNLYAATTFIARFVPDTKQSAKVIYTTDGNGTLWGGPVIEKTTQHVQIVTGEVVREDGSVIGDKLTTIPTYPKDGYEFDRWIRVTPEKTIEGAGSALTDEMARPNLNQADDGLYQETEFKAIFKPRTNLSYTVNYYWNGTEIPVKPSKTVLHQTFGAEATESPIGADDYTPVSNEPKKIKIGADSTQNVINFYYYRNVKLTANSDMKTYNGEDQSVSGYTCAVAEKQQDGSVEYVPWTGEKPLIFDGISASGSGKDVNEKGYPVTFNESPIGKHDDLYYVIESQTGTLTITPRQVTLTSETASKPYDGNPLTKPDVTVTGDGFVKGEVSDIKAEGTVTHVSHGKVTNTITYTKGANFKESNYTITKKEGELWITPNTNEVVVTIEGRTKTVTYNGEEHTAWQYDVISISDPLYETAPGEVPNFWNKNAKKASGTDAGTYPMGWEAADFENTNTNFSNVKFVVTDGQLVINPRPVVLTSASDKKVYDGEALTNHTVTEMFGTESPFPNGEGLEYDFTGSQTNVGKSENTFTYKANEKTKLTNYAITTEYGTLEVTPVTDRVTVKIKGKTDSVMYDGKPHFVFGFDAEPSNALYNPNEDIQFNGFDEDMIAEGTDAGTYTMGLEVSDFTNKSKNFTNVRFEVVEDGKLEIKKRSVKLTSASDEKVYDGKPLMNETVAVGGDGFADGEGATYDFTGSQTDVGESDNLFTFEVNAGTKKENYTFEVAIGKLKVNPVTDKVTVTVTEKSDTVTYDGGNHTVSGYASMTADNPLYDVENDVQETPNAAWAANGTDAGEYPLGIVAGDFKNTNKNFTNVEFVVVDGALKIDPAPVTLQAPIASKTYDGTPLKAEDYGHSFVEGLDFADDFASISVEGSQTQAGSSVSQIKEVVPKKGKDLKNYKLTFLPGSLTVAKRSVLLTSQSATKTYDGSALTRPAVTITGDGFVPGELAKVEATGSITNVGSTPNAIQYTTTGAFNPANYSIALSVGTLTVTAKPEPEPRRTFNLTVNYVYQNGKRAAASYNRGGLKNGETFDITSPVIAGYTASETVVSGTIDNRDIKVTVIYTADGVNLDDYGVPLGLGNITMNVGDCFE